MEPDAQMYTQHLCFFTVLSARKLVGKELKSMDSAATLALDPDNYLLHDLGQNRNTLISQNKEIRELTG